MRIAASVTSISWIPSEAISGALKLPFEIGMAHWDAPLPDVISDLEALRAADRFRFANELRAYVDVEDGRIVDYGHLGDGYIGSTTIRLGSKGMTFAGVPFETLRPDPEVGDGWVRFVQTAGGRTGAPAPRRVRRPPYVQISAPTAWTTLALTIHADGRSEHELIGASPFPRHWIYDRDRRLVQKSGMIDFKSWSLEHFGDNSPWGDQESPAMVTEVETALERQLSSTVMRGAKPKIRKIATGETLTEQGVWGAELYLLLDGVLSVEVNGDTVGEVGPGAILGERASLEGGKRTSTLRAVTPCKVAVASADQIDHEALVEVATGHRREHDRL
ncbi:MAG: cyclic nucleotide-binding domain-containing protein [Actinobacteria bacterium]|nr:cyclic nucleotide-binding domain-containing protein [Actinomycetota bacterium]